MMPAPPPPALSPRDSEELRNLRRGLPVLGGLLLASGPAPLVFVRRHDWGTETGALTGAALAWLLVATALGPALLVVGRQLKKRRSHAFCVAVCSVAAVVLVPVGTVICGFALTVLLRPAVKARFE